MKLFRFGRGGGRGRGGMTSPDKAEGKTEEENSFVPLNVRGGNKRGRGGR